MPLTDQELHALDPVIELLEGAIKAIELAYPELALTEGDLIQQSVIDEHASMQVRQYR